MGPAVRNRQSHFQRGVLVDHTNPKVESNPIVVVAVIEPPLDHLAHLCVAGPRRDVSAREGVVVVEHKVAVGKAQHLDAGHLVGAVRALDGPPSVTAVVVTGADHIVSKTPAEHRDIAVIELIAAHQCVVAGAAHQRVAAQPAAEVIGHHTAGDRIVAAQRVDIAAVDACVQSLGRVASGQLAHHREAIGTHAVEAQGIVGDIQAQSAAGVQHSMRT